MSTGISYCGLNCNTCPIYLATIEQDTIKKQQMRNNIAEQINSLYNIKLTAADITDCDGCRANTARIYKGCLNCEVRKCGTQKQVENCASCKNYACSILEKHFLMEPESKKNLEEIRKVR